MENQNSKKYKSRYNHIKPDGPKKLLKNRICVNLSNCKYKVVENVCKARNYRIIKNDEENMNFDIIFTDLSCNQDFLGRMKNYQKINHFPGILKIARKNFLAYHLRKMKKKFPEFYDFFPETYCLPSDNSLLMKEFDKTKRKTFIVKPDSAAEGRGIFLIRKFESINVKDSYIVQKYLKNPFLIDGLKFDLRVYVFITSVSPLNIYVYKDGLVRLATDLYQKPDDKNIKNLFMHLTNYAINKKSFKFQHCDNNNFNKGHKRSFESLWQAVRNINRSPKEVFDDMKKTIIKTLTSVQPILEHIYNSSQPNDYSGLMCFDLLGFDIILDDDLKPYVLEVNHAPSLNLDTPLDKKLKTEMMGSMFDIMNIDLEKRRAMILKERRALKKRLIEGKRRKVSIFEKNEMKTNFLKEEYKNLKDRIGNFDLIYPNYTFDEPYDEFMKYAKKINLERTGVINQKPKKRFVNKLNKNKLQKRVKSVRIKKPENNLKKMQMINNSINRLYKQAFLKREKNKENISHNRVNKKLQSFMSIPIKTTIVNLELNLP